MLVPRAKAFFAQTETVMRLRNLSFYQQMLHTDDGDTFHAVICELTAHLIVFGKPMISHKDDYEYEQIEAASIVISVGDEVQGYEVGVFFLNGTVKWRGRIATQQEIFNMFYPAEQEEIYTRRISHRMHTATTDGETVVPTTASDEIAMERYGKTSPLGNQYIQTAEGNPICFFPDATYCSLNSYGPVIRNSAEETIINNVIVEGIDNIQRQLATQKFEITYGIRRWYWGERNVTSGQRAVSVSGIGAFGPFSFGAAEYTRRDGAKIGIQDVELYDVRQHVASDTDCSSGGPEWHGSLFRERVNYYSMLYFFMAYSPIGPVRLYWPASQQAARSNDEWIASNFLADKAGERTDDLFYEIPSSTWKTETDRIGIEKDFYIYVAAWPYSYVDTNVMMPMYCIAPFVRMFSGNALYFTHHKQLLGSQGHSIAFARSFKYGAVQIFLKTLVDAFAMKSGNAYVVDGEPTQLFAGGVELTLNTSSTESSSTWNSALRDAIFDFFGNVRSENIRRGLIDVSGDTCYLSMFGNVYCYLEGEAFDKKERVRADILELTNQQRAAHGAPKVALDLDLTNAIQAHVEECARRKVLDHYDEEYRIGPLARAAGSPIGRQAFVSLTVAENLARNTYPLEQAASIAVDTWMASTMGHRENLLDPEHEGVGIGVAVGADGKTYCGQLFVKPVIP